MAPPITEKELHKLVAKLSPAGKRRLLKVLRAELARLAQDGHLRGGRPPPPWRERPCCCGTCPATLPQRHELAAHRRASRAARLRQRVWASLQSAERKGDDPRTAEAATALPIGGCSDGPKPILALVAKCRNFATRHALNGGNGLAGAQMSCKIRALKSPAGRLVGYARVSTTQLDLTRQVRALKGERCAEIFTDTASGNFARWSPEPWLRRWPAWPKGTEPRAACGTVCRS